MTKLSNFLDGLDALLTQCYRLLMKKKKVKLTEKDFIKVGLRRSQKGRTGPRKKSSGEHLGQLELFQKGREKGP